MKLSAVKNGTVRAVKSYFYRRWDMQTLMNHDGVRGFILDHLKRVYCSLFVTSTNLALGVFFKFFWDIGGSFTALAFLGSFIWLCRVPYWRRGKKIGALSTAALFGGASLGSLIMFLGFDLRLMFSFLVGTSLLFECFWILSVVKEDIDDIYINSLISSATLVLIWLFTASYAFGGSSTSYILLYFGTLFLWEYTVVYSQDVALLVRHQTEEDYAKHTLGFISDMPAIIARSIYLLPLEVLKWWRRR